MTATLLILLVLLIAVSGFLVGKRDKQIAGRRFEVAQLDDVNRALSKLKSARAFQVPPATVAWDVDDCEVLRHFLNQPTGRKLIEICGMHALQEALKEAQGDRANPQASGMDAMLRFQFNLASETVREKISGASAAQDANKTADGEQNGAAPVEIRRSF